MIRLANKEAKKSNFYRHRLGAVIVKGNRVLSVGHNDIRYTKEFRNPTLHAEEAAILKLLKAKRGAELVGSDIYISRMRANNLCGLSKPCDRCFALIRAVGMDHVHYTTNEGNVETISCSL